MPYLMLGGDFSVVEGFTLSGSLAYSPWVESEDELVHVYQDMISTGDMDGDAIMANFSGQYTISSSMYVEAGMNYTLVDVDGTMSTTVTGGVDNMDEESETEQISAYLQLGFTF